MKKKTRKKLGGVTFGRHFWTSLLDITFRRHFYTSLLDVPFGHHFLTSLLKVTFGHNFCLLLLPATEAMIMRPSSPLHPVLCFLEPSSHFTNCNIMLSAHKVNYRVLYFYVTSHKLCFSI